MHPVLFDSSVYISISRSAGESAVSFRQMAAGAPVWLSSVVLEELYAGATGRGQRAVERLHRDFERAKRVLVPNLNDWAQTGGVLARLATKYGYDPIGRGRLTNDTLIATSAARWGIMVTTMNSRDFARLSEFLTFHWRVATI